MEGDARHSSPGPALPQRQQQGAPSNPPTMSQEDMSAFLRRRHFESTRRLLPVLRELGFSVRLIRPTGGGFWRAAAAAEEASYGNGGFGAVPASSEAAARLPETTAREAGDQRECCGVCLDEFAEDDRIRTMPCSHGFHESCIVMWLGISRLCPLCRFALPAAEA